MIDEGACRIELGQVNQYAKSKIDLRYNLCCLNQAEDKGLLLIGILY